VVFSADYPCHFDAPIEVGPQQFRQAFTFLEKKPSGEDTWEAEVSLCLRRTWNSSGNSKRT
jgi:hypothetical protein